MNINEIKDSLQRADEVLKKATEVIANKEQIIASHKEEISKMTDEEKKDNYIKILEIDNKGLKEMVERRDETIKTLLQQLEELEGEK
jgi:predicted nuclease with TOPRIM domain